MAKKSIAAIRESLMKQLENLGGLTDHFAGLIEDYCYYERQERKMQADVKKRGLTFKTTSAQGYEIEKDNPSVKSAYIYNKQKLAIIKELGISVDNVVDESNAEL